MRTVQAKTSQYNSTDDTRAGANLLARRCVSSSCAVAWRKNMKHTPTPWTAGETEVSQATLIFDSAGNTVANCEQWPVDRPHEERIMNARFIVEAVNNHDTLKKSNAALLEALREAKRGTLIEGPLSCTVLGGALDTTRAILYKAIALAEGRKDSTK